MNQSDEILALNSVSKRFPGVLALDNVSFSLRRGEAHALCGENGAGKSTLMKVMSGVYQADEGELVYKGKVCSFGSSVDAEAAGIAIIHQELNLIPHLSVAENIFLAREPVRGFFIEGAADHFRHDGVERDRMKVIGADEFAVAQHRHPVDNVLHFFQPVRDIHHAHAIAFQFIDDREQLARFAFRQ